MRSILVLQQESCHYTTSHALSKEKALFPCLDVIYPLFPFFLQSISVQFKYTVDMQGKPSESDLKTRLLSQRINETTIYYSLVKKQAKTFSILSNDRLLIYDNVRRILFYNNDYKNLPFAPQLPNPKNDVSTPIGMSTFKNPNNTAEIQVRHTGKNAKGEMETVEWNFTCENQQLAKEWMTLFEQEKSRIISEATGQKGGAFIHDTLLQAVRQSSPPKETILKPQEQLIRTTPPKDPPPRAPSIIKPTGNSYLRPEASDVKPKQESFIMDPQSLPPSNQNSRISIKRPQAQLQESQIQLPLLGSQSVIRTKNTKDPQPPRMEISEVRRVEVSRVREEEERSSIKYSVNDWNMKFLRDPHQATIVQFQQAAESAFTAAWPKDTPTSGKLRRHEAQGLLVSMANLKSEQAHRLKREFRNYHFILESCKTKLVAGVPLCCLIEWQGVLGLVKAPIPRNCPRLPIAKAISQIRQLQRYTRVGNNILQLASLYDVTQVYGMNGDKKLIFIDELIEYIPTHADQDLPKTTLRPEFLLDSVTQVVPGGDVKQSSRDWKALSVACEGLVACMRELSSHLNGQQSLWAQGRDLKEVFHSYGINLKLLPRIYAELSNKHVKRQLMSVMAAKVAKQLVGQAYAEVFVEGQTASRVRMVQGCLKNFIQGNTAGSSEFWKDLSVTFKKQYGIPLNNSEVVGGFFLNSLIKLLNLSCDLSKLNKSKKIFKQEGIIQQGFVVAIEPKSKSYYRFSTEIQEKVRFAVADQRKDETVYEDLVKQLRLQTNPLPLQFSQGTARECLLEFLSYYTPPKALDPNAPLRGIPIYASIFQQPPSGFSLRLTRAYLQWSIKKQCGEQFKKGIQNALKIADYWLQETHLHHAVLYELLSDYYASVGNADESVNFMKEALSRSIRAVGAQSKAAGNRYYQLGERQLKAGHKREALENLTKAKQNMEANKNKTLKYPQLLLRLASLHLNAANLEACIEGCLQAIRQFEDYDRDSGTNGLQTEGLKIKTFQVLSRAYEINGRRDQMRQMALLCAKKFNKCRSPWTYEQMVRICLAALIFRSPADKGRAFAQLLYKMQAQEGPMSRQGALRELMKLSQSTVVMERFIARFDIIQRTIAEGSSKRGFTQESSQFMQISELLGGVVGVDFVQGLVHQKQYE